MIWNLINRFLTRIPLISNVNAIGYNCSYVGNFIWYNTRGINISSVNGNLTRSSIFNSNVSENICSDIIRSENGYTIIPTNGFKIPFTNVPSYWRLPLSGNKAGNIGSRVDSFSINGTTWNAIISYNGINDMDGRGNERMELKKRLYKSYKSRKLSLPSTKSRRRHMQSNR